MSDTGPHRHRLILCTYPSLYSDLVLNKLLDMPEIELVGVVFSSRHGHSRTPHFATGLDHLRRSGIHYAGYLSVLTQLYPLLRRLMGRPTARQRLQQAGIAWHTSADINSDTSVAFLEALKPDWLLSAHFNQLISPRVLSLPTQACLNIHPSLLPDLKGVDPAFFALLRGYASTGVSLHIQNPVFDEGEVLAQRSLEIGKNDSLMALNIRLFKEGTNLLQTFFKQPEPSPSALPSGEGCYDSWPSARQVGELRKQRRLVGVSELMSYVIQK